MTWNTEELLTLCPSSLTDAASVYVKSFARKIDQTLFLVQQLQSPKYSSLPFRETELDKTAFQQIQLEVEIFTQSIAQNLHSLADVMAHIINELILIPLNPNLLPGNLRLWGRKVSMQNVEKSLKGAALSEPIRRQYLDHILYAIQTLRHSPEFAYINAFVNTIKHRQLVDTEFALQFEAGQPRFVGFRLDAFEYEGQTFASKPIEELITRNREQIIDRAFELGETINNYCRAIYIMQAGKPIKVARLTGKLSELTDLASTPEEAEEFDQYAQALDEIVQDRYRAINY